MGVKAVGGRVMDVEIFKNTVDVGSIDSVQFSLYYLVFAISVNLKVG